MGFAFGADENVFAFFGYTEEAGSFVCGIDLFDQEAGADHPVEDVDASSGFEQQVDADEICFAGGFSCVDGVQEIIPFQLDAWFFPEGLFQAGALERRDASERAGKVEAFLLAG